MLTRNFKSRRELLKMRENKESILGKLNKPISGGRTAAQAMRDSVVSYGKNVIGGAKIVGNVLKKVDLNPVSLQLKGLKKGAEWVGNQISKDMKGGEKKWKDLERKNEMERTGEYEYEGPTIETTSKKNPITGEIINPTKEDKAKYDAKYKTIRTGRGTSNGYMRR